jgi:putative spermidine/putrescine transport system substrate-binding protein
MRHLLALALVALLCACGGEGKPQAAGKRAAVAPAPKLEGALDVLMRAEAIAPGGEGADWRRDFETGRACKLRVRTAESSAALLALAAQSGADLVLAGGDIAESLVAAGSVRPIDPALVPALAQLEPRLRELPGAVVDGRRFGVPWRWQPNVLAYDSSAHPQPPTSWGALFEPAAAGKPASALLAAPEPMAIADAAVYLRATRPDLRIVDPFRLDERQYAAALVVLYRQQGALRGSWHDAATQAEGFRNGVSVGASTPAQVRAMQAQGLPVAWTLPEEGGTAQVEMAMLHADAKHPNCALAWMQWSLTPRAQALLAARTGALPVLPAACLSEPLAGADACARDGLSLLPRLHPWRVPPARCGRARCVPYSRWTRDYLALLGQ